MTDLEITRLCAEAMGIETMPILNHPECQSLGVFDVARGCHCYWPLTDDLQAMALVKKFGLTIMRGFRLHEDNWTVEGVSPCIEVNSSDLNRAICECVAKMQASK